MSVLSVAKKLNKEFKNDNLGVMADVVPHYERLTTGALGFDYPTGGGLPLGRIVTFAGLEHSGKTTGACMMLSAFQRKYPNKTCVYCDVEHSLDIEFQCAMTGIDPTKMLYVNPEGMSGEDIFEYLYELQSEDDIGLIVLDSIPALVSSRDYDTDIGEDKGMAAGIAKPLAKFIKRMVDQVSMKKNILILVNQVREVGKTFTGATIYGEPGGHAPKYYSSVKVRFGTRKFTKGDKMDLSDGEEADGFRLLFKITKNKTFSTVRGGGWFTFRYETGYDWKQDLLEIAIKFDFIKRPNNQTYLLVNLETGEVYKNPENGEELKFRGKQAMLDYLDTHVDFQKEYLDMINKCIAAPDASYGKLLDARVEKDIDAQEKSVMGNNDQTEEQFLREQEQLEKQMKEAENAPVVNDLI